jgi:signal transduction histidine kinase
MNDPVKKLARQYVVSLRKYLRKRQEADLEQAYELGRVSMARELGVLDVAKVHEEALETLFHTEEERQTVKAAETFFLEALSPFEATHRGFRETNSKLQEAVAIVEKRNRELEVEIRERERTEKALRESEENLRNLSNQVLHAQEEERKRISLELHDEVGQALTGISMSLESLKKNGDTKAPTVIRKFADTQCLLQETMDTVHRFARELRPAMLDELGLLPALRSYLKGFGSRTGLRVHFRGDPIAEELGNDQKTVLFRVAQESLTNVGKHAHASEAKVTISKLGDAICMEVADNGRSFTADLVNSAESKKRLGLLGMQERVRLVHGEFTIDPRPGEGTKVRAVIPFNSPDAAMLSQRMRHLNNKNHPLRAQSSRRSLKLKALPLSRSHYGKDQSSTR